MRKLILILLILLSIFYASTETYAFSDLNDNKFLRRQEIIEDIEKDITSCMDEKEFSCFEKGNLTMTRDLLDINGEKYAVFCLFSNDTYIIYDYRVNGFGVLESGEVSTLPNILSKLKNDLLFYIFPSQIMTYSEKEDLYTEIRKQKNNLLVLPSPGNQTSNNEIKSSLISQVGLTNSTNPYFDVAKIKDDAKFLEISEGTKKFYGGNQNWFSEKHLKDKGCGTVAASNITAYMSKFFNSKKALYTRSTFTKTNFVKHMYDIEEYLSPSVIGIPTLGAFEKGVENFAKSRGVTLNAYWSNNKVTKETFSNYIKSGLKANYPVAYLQYYNSNQVQYNWHWMTITKFTKDLKNNKTSITVSTWGGKKVLNFDALWSGNLACGVLYFK